MSSVIKEKKIKTYAGQYTSHILHMEGKQSFGTLTWSRNKNGAWVIGWKALILSWLAMITSKKNPPVLSTWVLSSVQNGGMTTSRHFYKLCLGCHLKPTDEWIQVIAMRYHASQSCWWGDRGGWLQLELISDLKI